MNCRIYLYTFGSWRWQALQDRGQLTIIHPGDVSQPWLRSKSMHCLCLSTHSKEEEKEDEEEESFSVEGATSSA